MKSRSFSSSGLLFTGVFVVYLVMSGVLVKLLTIVAIIWFIKIIICGPSTSSKEYDKPPKRSKPNLPPALAEKLARRHN